MYSRARDIASGGWGFAVAILLAAPLTYAAPERVENAAQELQSALALWQAETTEALNRALADSSAARLMRPNNTIVQVTFTLGEDGRAKNIKVLPGDANWPARRAAIFAVRQLANLDEAPVPHLQKTRFLANIVFFDREDVRSRLLERLHLSEAQRHSSADELSAYLVIGNVPAAPHSGGRPATR